MSQNTARRRFPRFKNGNFDLRDGLHIGGPIKFDEERLNNILHKNTRQTIRDLAEQTGCDFKKNFREHHLYSIGNVQNLREGGTYELFLNLI